jgi:hypothetical protein
MPEDLKTFKVVSGSVKVEEFIYPVFKISYSMPVLVNGSDIGIKIYVAQDDAFSGRDVGNILDALAASIAAANLIPLEGLMRRISLEESENEGWTVREVDRYQHKLGPDECLYMIACILTGRPGPPYGGLLTAEEHAERDARMFGPKPKLLDPWEKQLPGEGQGS